MNAKIVINERGNKTQLIVHRGSAFKSMWIATCDLDKTLRHAIIVLSNLGYDVEVA